MEGGESPQLIDCKTVGFFFSKSVKKSVKRGVRVLRSLVPDLLFDCSRVLEYGKIRTVLQSTQLKEQPKPLKKNLT